jgi:hypothetical protein
MANDQDTVPETGPITTLLLLTREIKYRIAMAKASFKMEKKLFARKLELNLRKNLVNCYIWGIALYSAET